MQFELQPAPKAEAPVRERDEFVAQVRMSLNIGRLRMPGIVRARDVIGIGFSDDLSG